MYMPCFGPLRFLKFINNVPASPVNLPIHISVLADLPRADGGSEHKIFNLAVSEVTSPFS